MRPHFSLIVPTRGRPDQLRRMLDSVAATAHRPEQVEVVLVVDDDDRASLISHPRLTIRGVVLPPGQTMGTLNNAGFAQSTGQYVMLLNDDVILRTPGWDSIALKCFRKFPDPYVLVHVNDTLMRQHLCTFPLTSRAFYEFTQGVCPTTYERYRIDDHIEDVFNLLVVLGERRVVYLPDVIFEHDNAVLHPEAGLVYQSDPEILARDAPRFESYFAQRKELALALATAIDGQSDPLTLRIRRAILDQVEDSFSLRTQNRQRVIRFPWWRGPQDGLSAGLQFVRRICSKSPGELLRAVRRRWQKPLT